jgi:ComF family protein
MKPSFWMSDFVGLFFPNVCQSCGIPLFSHETVLCTRCKLHLPYTNFQYTIENPVYQIFYGRFPLYSATSLLFFNKGGMAQHMIHRLKYKRKKEIGTYLGQLLGQQLSKSEYFSDADAILPVPLHPKKEFKRGYNQSLMIAKGMSASMQAKVLDDILFRQIHTSSQTKKSRYGRWENVKNIFSVRQPERLQNKHIILVDDVITTGSTLEACAMHLIKIEGIKISVASLAYSQG